MRPPCFPTVFEPWSTPSPASSCPWTWAFTCSSRLARRFGPAVPGPVTRYGFPAPGRLAAADPAELRALGFSTAKARTITAIAGQAAAGALDLEALRDAGDDRAMSTLLGLPHRPLQRRRVRDAARPARYHVLPGDDVGARDDLRRRFGLAEDAGYDAVASAVAPLAALRRAGVLPPAARRARRPRRPRGRPVDGRRCRASRWRASGSGPGDRRAAARARPGRRCATSQASDVLLGDPGAELVSAPTRSRTRRAVTAWSACWSPGYLAARSVRLGHDVLLPGDRVLLSGPYGLVHRRARRARRRCCSSRADPGWPRCAPWPRRALRRRTRIPVVLFFSARTQRDLIDDERFRDLAAPTPRIPVPAHADPGGRPAAGRADPGDPRGLVPGPVRLAGLRRRSARVRDRVRGSRRRLRSRARPGARRGVLHRAAAVGSRAARRSEPHDQEQDLHQDRG